MNDQMWSTYVDLYRFFVEVGPSVTFLPFTALADAEGAVATERVEEERTWLLEHMDVEPGADDERLQASVRASLALEHIARAEGFDAVALNDVDDNLHQALGLRPGFYPRSFYEERRVAVPESDIAMAALALALTTSTGSRFMYTEPFFSDIESNTFVGGHAGPNDPYITGAVRARISEDLEYRDSGHRHAGAPFAWYEFPHGPATIVHMSEKPAGYTVVSALVECVPTGFTLHGYPYGAFRTREPVAEFFERVMQVGTTQHFLSFPGDIRAATEALARVNEWQHIRL
jgi:L-arabinose isomerase